MTFRRLRTAVGARSTGDDGWTRTTYDAAGRATGVTCPAHPTGDDAPNCDGRVFAVFGPFKDAAIWGSRIYRPNDRHLGRYTVDSFANNVGSEADMQRKSLGSLWTVIIIVLLADLASIGGILLEASARGDESAVRTEIGTFLWPSIVFLSVGLIYVIGIIPGRRREFVLSRRYVDSVVFNVRGRPTLTSALVNADLLPSKSKLSLLGYSVTAVVGREGFSLWKRSSDEFPLLKIGVPEIATMSTGQLTIKSITYPALVVGVRHGDVVSEIAFMVSSDGPLGATPARLPFIQNLVARSLETMEQDR